MADKSDTITGSKVVDLVARKTNPKRPVKTKPRRPGGASTEEVTIREKIVGPIVASDRKNAVDTFTPELPKAMNVLRSALSNEDVTAQAITAMREVFDRVFGRPAQKMAVESRNLSVSIDTSAFTRFPKDQVVDFAKSLLDAEKAAMDDPKRAKPVIIDHDD